MRLLRQPVAPVAPGRRAAAQPGGMGVLQPSLSRGKHRLLRRTCSANFSDMGPTTCRKRAGQCLQAASCLVWGALVLAGWLEW